MLAPSFRFAHGYIMITAFLPLILLSNVISIKFVFLQHYFKYSFYVTAAVLSLFIVYSVFKETNELAFKQNNYFITQIEAMPADILDSTSIQNTKIYFPLKAISDCWDSPLPCTPTLSNNLELRGESISDGFKLKSPLNR